MNKMLIAAFAASAVILAACGDNSSAPAQQSPSQPAAGSAPTPIAVPEPETTAPDVADTEIIEIDTDEVVPDQEPEAVPELLVTLTYTCDSGKIVEITPTSVETIRVKYNDKTQDMKIAISASGARYVGEDMEWWGKGIGSGSEATLFQSVNGNTGDIIETCTQQ